MLIRQVMLIHFYKDMRHVDLCDNNDENNNRFFWQLYNKKFGIFTSLTLQSIPVSALKQERVNILMLLTKILGMQIVAKLFESRHATQHVIS